MLAVMPVERSEHQQAMLVGLEAYVNALPELLVEYINEAEHQDGCEFWDLFQTKAEAIADFTLYVQHRAPNPTALNPAS